MHLQSRLRSARWLSCCIARFFGVFTKSFRIILCSWTSWCKHLLLLLLTVSVGLILKTTLCWAISLHLWSRRTTFSSTDWTGVWSVVANSERWNVCILFLSTTWKYEMGLLLIWEIKTQGLFPSWREILVWYEVWSHIDVIEKVFTVTFNALFSPKTGMATKEGVDQRTSNLFLVLIACARSDIERIFRQYYQDLLVQHPTLLDGILNEKSLMGYKERHIRYNYNRSFTHFYQVVQRHNENKSISNSLVFNKHILASSGFFYNNIIIIYKNADTIDPKIHGHRRILK